MAVTFRSASTLQASTAGITIAVPTGYQADDLLLLHLFGEGNATHPATITGWTQIGTTERSENSGTNTTTSHSVWWKISTASESSVTIADMGAQSFGAMSAWIGADTTSPIHQFAQSSNATTATNQSATGVTTTISDCLIVASITSGDGVTASGYSATTPSTLTERFDQSSNTGSDGSLHIASGDRAGTGATGSVSWTFSAVEEHATFVLAIAESQDKSGTATVSGTGTVTVVPEKDTERTISISDTVAVTVASNKDAPRDASVSGSGSVTASGSLVSDVDIRVGFENPTGSLFSGVDRQVFRTIVRRHLAGTDNVNPTLDMWLYENGTAVRQLVTATTVTSDAGQIISGYWDAAEITNKNDVECRIRGNMTTGANGGRSIDIETIEWAAQGSDTVEFQGTATVSGTGTVTATGKKAADRTVSISSTGTVTATGSAVEFHSGTASVTSTGSVTATGEVAFEATGAVTSTGTVTSTGEKGAESAVTVTSTGTVTVTYSILDVKTGTATVSGTGTVTVVHTASHRPAATVTGTGTATVVGSMGAERTAAVTSTGTVTIVPTAGRQDAGSVSGAATVTATGYKNANVAVAVTGTGSITITYSLIEAREGTASVSGTGTVTVVHTGDHNAVAAVTGAGSVSVIGAKAIDRITAISSTGTVTVAYDIFAVTNYMPPTSIEAFAGWKGTLADIDDPIDSPDANWMVL